MKAIAHLAGAYLLIVGLAEVLNQNSGSQTGFIHGVASLPSVGAMLPGNSGYDDVLVGSGVIALAWYFL